MMELDTIICGDNATVMATWPDSCIDLVVTSPPYDNLRKYGGHSWDFPAVARELSRILKPGGVIVWVVGDATVDGSETLTSMKQAIHFREVCGLNVHDTMIYMKDNPPPVGGPMRYLQAWEYLFVFSRGTPKTFSPIVEDRRNKWNDKRTVRTRPVTRNKAGVFTEKTVKIEGQVRLQNIFCYVVSGGSVASDMFAHEHPAIFPEALVRDQIVSWSNPGDVVLDPFAGSGTTLKMAKEHGRRFIGIEVNQTYVEICRKRVAQVVLPLAPDASGQPSVKECHEKIPF